MKHTEIAYLIDDGEGHYVSETRERGFRWTTDKSAARGFATATAALLYARDGYLREDEFNVVLHTYEAGVDKNYNFVTTNTIHVRKAKVFRQDGTVEALG